MAMRKNPILTYLANYENLTIPKYQRGYCWTKDNCEELFNDLVSVINRGNQHTHYLGAIISSQEGDTDDRYSNKKIIDGQQRLTTLSLLVLSIIQISKELTLFENNDSEHHIARLKNSIWNASDPNRNKLNLQHHNDNAKDYRRVVEFVTSDRTGKFLDDNTIIATNFNHFYEYITTYLKKTESLARSGKQLFNALNKLVIIDITLDGNDDPQQVFESMNATGLDLTEFDKCRNFFLIDSNDVSEQLLQAWDRLERNLMELPQDKAQVKFLFTYLKYHKAKNNSSIKLQEKNYYYYVKTFIKRNERDSGFKLQFLTELSQMSDDFKNMILGYDNDKFVASVLKRLVLIDNTQLWPVIFTLYSERRNGSIDNSMFASALNAIEVYNVRMIVCDRDNHASSNMSNFILKQFFLNRWKNENKADLVKACIINSPTESTRLPDDREFESFLQKLSYDGRKDVIKIVLWSIEYYLRRNDKEVDCANASIEHIMPQSKPDCWIEELQSYDNNVNVDEIYDSWLHRLGNLTLTGYNSQYSDASFCDKKNAKNEDGISIGFNSSAFRLNESVKCADHWTDREIRDRHKTLIDYCMTMWPYPESQTNLNTPIEDFEFSLVDSLQEKDVLDCDFVDFKISNKSFRYGEVLEDGTILEKMKFVEAIVLYLNSECPNEIYKIGDEVVPENPKPFQHIDTSFDLISIHNISPKSWKKIFESNTLEKEYILYLKIKRYNSNFVYNILTSLRKVIEQCSIDLSLVTFHVKRKPKLI